MLKKLFVFFISGLFSNSIYAQVVASPKADTTVTIVNVTNIPEFVDSLKKKLLADTVKFHRNDVVSTAQGKVNNKTYSPLYFVDIRYSYALDIVEGIEVLEFANEFLVADKIASISLVNDPKLLRRFAPHERNGVIMIQTKAGARVNYNVAGFKVFNRKESNFF